MSFCTLTQWQHEGAQPPQQVEASLVHPEQPFGPWVFKTKVAKAENLCDVCVCV